MSAARADVGDSVPSRVLLAGFGAANRAVAEALRDRGHEVAAFDDAADRSLLDAAGRLGIELVSRPEAALIDEMVRAAQLVIPTPGLPERHRVLASCAHHGVPTASEFDLARVWDSRPIAAVTGTSGKTTTTDLIVEALSASGVRAVAAGNNELPLVSAINDAQVEVFVVEASSFRLAHTGHLAATAACWLNLAPDHLDIHIDVESYTAAKARIWAGLEPSSRAVANAEDPVVMGRLRRGASSWTFAANGDADWRLVDGMLTGPCGPIIAAEELGRSMPHDIANALAASATATAVGASLDGLRMALSTFVPGAHRLQFVTSLHGVDYYNDSKATTPHATSAALAGLGTAVLIAGGQNKGLDLTPMLDGLEHIHAVVAVGAASEEVAEVFAGAREVHTVADMTEAVRVAAGLAQPGMAVLLSPGCASFDQYDSYAARGDDFMRIVAERSDAVSARGAAVRS